MRRDEQAESNTGHAFTIDAIDYIRYDARLIVAQHTAGYLLNVAFRVYIVLQ